MRSLNRRLGIIRPKYTERLAAYEAATLAPLFRSIEAEDHEGFERAFTAATDEANRQHVETGYPYIRWILPDEPPKDLDLGPQRP